MRSLKLCPVGPAQVKRAHRDPTHFRGQAFTEALDYDPSMAEETSTRRERKEQTRRAILDAALRLSGDTSLVAISLRQVAKEVGIVPTAFYRHFDSIEALGLALVDESFASLRAMLRDVRAANPLPHEIVDRSLSVLVDHVHRQRAHFLFISRERAAGPPAVRDEVARQIEQFSSELATDLARLPGTETWPSRDLRSLSSLIVTLMVTTVEGLLAAGRPAAEEAVVEEIRTQMKMVLVGTLNWRETPPPT